MTDMTHLVSETKAAVEGFEKRFLERQNDFEGDFSARLDALENAQLSVSNRPHGRTPGVLLNALMLSAGRSPVAGFERSADSLRMDADGDIEVPWQALMPDYQAALTTSHFEGETIEHDFLNVLRPVSILPGLNMRWYQGMGTGTISVPVLSGASANWAGDTDDLPDLGEGSASVSLTPKKIGAIVGLNAQVLVTTDIAAIENALASEMMRAVADRMDATFIASSQASNAPVGLSGIAATSTATNGATVTIALLDAQIASVEAVNARPSAMLINPKTARYLSQLPLFTGATQAVYDMDATMPSVRGVPAVVSRHIPDALTKGSSTTCSEIIVGDFPQAAVGAWWGGVRIRAGERGTDFAKGSITLRVLAHADLNVVRASAISRESDYLLA